MGVYIGPILLDKNGGLSIKFWDGLGPWIKEYTPILMRNHRREKDPSVSLKVANKMRILVARAYITEGVILKLTPFFYVPKGTYDIHMLFDEMVSGLNDSIWDKKFMFP